MIEPRRSKKNRSKNYLFNPYQNGIRSYDLAYLSSKRVLKKKNDNLQIDSGVSVNFKDTPQIFNVGLGLSYRLNLNAIK